MINVDKGKHEKQGVARLIEKFCHPIENDNIPNAIAAFQIAGKGSSLLLPPFGVNLKWFDELSLEIKQGKFCDLIERVKQMTTERRESVVEMLQRIKPQFVKEIADIYVSYSGQDCINDVVNSLKDLILSPENKHKDMFIWMDVFVMNLHKMDFDVKLWMNSVEEIICIIQRIIVILSPWNKAVDFLRPWQLWELRCAATQNENTKMEVMIVSSQLDTFRKKLRSYPHGLVNRIEMINVSKAKTLIKSDWEMIMNAVRTSKGGTMTTLKRVIDLIHHWMTREAVKFVHELGLQGNNLEDLAKVYDQVGHLFGAQRLTDLKVWYKRKTLELHRQINGDCHQIVASDLRDLSRMLKYHKNQEAELMLREALIILKNDLGSDNSEISWISYDLADVQLVQSKYSEAEQLYQEALAISKKKYGDDDPCLISSLNCLSQTLMNQQKYEQAEILYREALRIERKADRGELDLESCLQNLAHVLQIQNKYEEAEEFLREIRTLTESRRIELKQIVQLSLIADWQKKKRNYDRAESYYFKELAIMRQALGDDLPKIASCLVRIANLLQYQGKFEKAEQMLQEILLIKKERFGNDHPKVANTLICLAYSLQGQGKYEEAESVCRESLKIRKNAFGNNHSRVIFNLKYLTILLQKQAKYDERESE